jgi:hypothetical protein
MKNIFPYFGGSPFISTRVRPRFRVKNGQKNVKVWEKGGFFELKPQISRVRSHSWGLVWIPIQVSIKKNNSPRFGGSQFISTWVLHDLGQKTSKTRKNQGGGELASPISRPGLGDEGSYWSQLIFTPSHTISWVLVAIHVYGADSIFWSYGFLGGVIGLIGVSVRRVQINDRWWRRGDRRKSDDSTLKNTFWGIRTRSDI